jgi:hypothetical protein
VSDHDAERVGVASNDAEGRRVWGEERGMSFNRDDSIAQTV